MRKVIIGVGVAGVVAGGGTLVYGNYNPVFRNQVNEKIPGFASWTDKVAGAWVSVTDYFNPKPGDPKKSEREGTLVYEHNKAKTRARLDELKKSQPTPASPQKTETRPDKVGEGPKAKQEKKTESVPEDKPKSEAEGKPEVVATKDKPEVSDLSESKGVAKSEVVAAKDEKEPKSKDGEAVTSVKETETAPSPQQGTKKESVTRKEPSPPSAGLDVTSSVPSPESSDVAGHSTQEPNEGKGGADTVVSDKE